MKIIKPSFEIMDWTDPFKHIEQVGRVCYKSEDKITEDSAEPFVQKMINQGHTAILEHISWVDSEGLDDAIAQTNGRISSLTNLKRMFEHKEISREEELLNPYYKARHHISVRFICDRGFTHEATRHRCYKFPDEQIIRAKYAQESTRYCNYSKDKFGNEIAVIEPVQLGTRGTTMTAEDYWYNGCKLAESNYFSMLDHGASPQEARAVLPIGLKTEIVCTTTIEHWEYIFKLRCAEAAHPEMRRLMIPLREEFIKRGYVDG